MLYLCNIKKENKVLTIKKLKIMEELRERVEEVVIDTEYAYKVWIELLEAESELKFLKEKIRYALETEIENGEVPDDFVKSYRRDLKRITNRRK